MNTLISPHGADSLKPLFVTNDAERANLKKESEGLPSTIVSSATAGNAVMLAAGYFTPLDGYMNKADALSVGQSMQTTSGLFWPTPVLNLVKYAENFKVGDRVALLDPNVDGTPVLAIQTIQSIDTFTADELSTLTGQIFGTTDPEHPGVEAFNSQGNIALAGPIQVLNLSLIHI